jgi:hypothetical protein
MSDMEFRDDFNQAKVSGQCPVMLCPVKWNAVWQVLRVARVDSGTVNNFLNSVGLTSDFTPSPANPEVQTSKPEVIDSVLATDTLRHAKSWAKLRAS